MWAADGDFFNQAGGQGICQGTRASIVSQYGGEYGQALKAYRRRGWVPEHLLDVRSGVTTKICTSSMKLLDRGQRGMVGSMWKENYSMVYGPIRPGSA